MARLTSKGVRIMQAIELPTIEEIATASSLYFSGNHHTSRLFTMLKIPKYSAMDGVVPNTLIVVPAHKLKSGLLFITSKLLRKALVVNPCC